MENNNNLNEKLIENNDEIIKQVKDDLDEILFLNMLNKIGSKIIKKTYGKVK